VTTLDDIRQICAKLPGAVEGEGRFGFSVEVKGKAKGFLWSWLERVEPKKARVVNEGVIAIVVPNLTAKELIKESNPPYWVEDPHYNGYPAIIVRLSHIKPEEIEDLIIEGWRAKASKQLLAQWVEN